jgi:biopolymer transport protein ExbD
MGASAKSSDDDGDLVTDINITPLVDVVLVLLIVFMITIPAVVSSQSVIPVELPTSTSSQDRPLDIDLLPLKIVVRKEPNGTLGMYMGDKPTSEAQLRQMYNAGQINKKEAVQVLGDKFIAYGEVVKVMDMLNHIGLHKINLITKTTE